MKLLDVVFQHPACQCICDGELQENAEAQVQLLQPLGTTTLSDDIHTMLLTEQTTAGIPTFKENTGNLQADVDTRHKAMKDVLVERPRRCVGETFYAGQWLDTRRHGHGRSEHPGWGHYEGQFVNNRATGRGLFVKTTGDTYDGQWQDDRAHGFGQYQHASGESYRGQWEHDLKNGKGREVWPDGSVYDGDFYRGKKHGHGNYDAPDKSSYCGQFREDVMHGDGCYSFADGRVFDGQWKDSRMSGHGRMVWPDGKIYEGAFESDQRSGAGRLLWTNGRSYEGQFWKGKQHGKGVIIDKNGRCSRAQWRHGKRLGKLLTSSCTKEVQPVPLPTSEPEPFKVKAEQGLAPQCLIKEDECVPLSGLEDEDPALFVGEELPVKKCYRKDAAGELLFITDIDRGIIDSQLDIEDWIQSELKGSLAQDLLDDLQEADQDVEIESAEI